MKRFLSGLLSLTVLFAGIPAASEDMVSVADAAIAGGDVPADIAAIHIKEDDKHIGGDVVVAEIDPADENKVFSEIAKESKENEARTGEPNAMFFTKSSGDPANLALDDNRDLIAHIDSPADISQLPAPPPRLAPSVAPTHRHPWWEKLVELATNHHKKTAVVVAMYPGAGYAAFYYSMSSTVVESLGAGGVGFLEYLMIGLFSKQWLYFSKHVVGNGVAKVFYPLTVGAAWVFRRPKPSRHLAVYYRRTGQLLAAYGINVLATYSMMEVGGLAGSPYPSFVMFQNAFYGAHDVIDYKIEQWWGPKIAAVAAPLRLFGLMNIEVFALSGVTEAELLVGSAVGIFSILNIFKEPIKRHWRETKGSFAKLKEKLAGMNPARYATGVFSHKKSCEKELAGNL